MRLWVLSLIVLASLIGLNKAEPFTLSLEPRILKVCQGCPYESIQEAIDAASPGDVIKVYPMFNNPIVAYYPTAVIISKPLTLEAKPIPPWEVVLIPKKFPEQPGSGFGLDPIFDIRAPSGQVVIRGFVFQDEDIVWRGGADLILERNRFQRTTPWSIMVIGLEGPGQALLIENEINDIDRIEITQGAQVLFKSNRIRPRPDLPPEWGLMYILESQEIDKRAKVVLEQNLIEGSIIISCSSETRLDDNILIGRPVRGKQPRVGLMIGACAQVQHPGVVQANRNLIARYQIGMAIDLSVTSNDCRAATVEELQLSGQENVIEQNGQDLCPPDYPWPPGFRK
ncbi:MAG: hypothetical protein QXQ53_07145 [Candidatus Methanosuratincola sp.]